MRRVLATFGVTAFAAGMFAASAQASTASTRVTHAAPHAAAAGLLPVHVTLPGKQYGPPRPSVAVS